MNIFGMGPLEIILIMVIALIVFGPAKLPEIMGQVGRAIAEVRRTTGQLSDEFNRTIQAELQETRSVIDDTKSAVTGAHSSINAALTGTTPAPTLTAAPTQTVTAPTPNGTNGTNGNVAPPSTPPLADTSQWSWESPALAAASAAEAPATVAEPVVAQPVTPRKSKVRDELLPPY